MSFNQELIAYVRDNPTATPDVIGHLHSEIVAVAEAQKDALAEQRKELAKIAANQERVSNRQWMVIALLIGLLTTILADVMTRTLSPFLPNEPGVGFIFLIHHL